LEEFETKRQRIGNDELFEEYNSESDESITAIKKRLLEDSDNEN
jgi:hypothetical protein